MAFAELRSTVSAPWSELQPIRVGDRPSRLGTPDRYVLVDTGKKLLRIDIYVGVAARVFEEVVVWHGLVVVGFAEQVFVVRLADGYAKEIKLEGYFGHLYLEEDALLVASQCHLRRLSRKGELAWTSIDLGLDGVIVDRIENGVIYGQGEWDPPGGWRPFVLSLDTGCYVI